MTVALLSIREDGRSFEIDLGRVANMLEKIPFELSLSPVQSMTTNSPIGSLYLVIKTVDKPG